MIFIANFKMMLTSSTAINLIDENLPAYKTLAKAHAITLCPPVTALRELSKSLANTGINLGAQTCAASPAGAFTGEVSAQDLAQSGATYCLVGHSERRTLFYETDEIVAAKTNLLIQNNITPVICIGETLAEFKNNLTMTVLEHQLGYVLSRLDPASNQILIAYEPVWAIGTNLVPTQDQLVIIFDSLAKIIKKNKPNLQYKLLYGGNVSGQTIEMLGQISSLDGFLIGRASLDFQEFKKIVDYFN